jgi:hypothetical protein
MNLHQTHDRCAQSWDRLRQQWQQTLPDWQDSVRRQFEHQYWEPLETQVPALLRELEALARVIDQARQAVS